MAGLHGRDRPAGKRPELRGSTPAANRGIHRPRLAGAGGMSNAGSVHQGGRVRIGQSRRGSLLEASANVVFGFLLAFVMQGLIYPLMGIITTAQDNLLIA